VVSQELRARMNLAKEMITENKIIIFNKNTSKMIADGLSKILTGDAFKIFKNIILGTSSIIDKTTGGRWNFQKHNQFFLS
jgi:hypothetical protein